MTREKILFYARISYLDASIEYIKLLSTVYDVSVLIELSQNELHSNILDIDVDLSTYAELTPFNEVADNWGLNFLKPYLAKCLNVNFVIYKAGKNIGSLLTTTQKIYRYVKLNKPDFIHFDDFSIRQSLLLPLIAKNRRRVIVNIHDPSPHSGESLWYINLIKTTLFKTANKFAVFSKFSHGLLKQRVPAKSKIFVLKLLPFTVFQTFMKTASVAEPQNISFIGRLSPYKGIDLFIDAIPLVLKAFPDQNFVIAGKPVYNYTISKDNLALKNVHLIQRHLSNGEMADITEQSKLIVCPYRDATQSGIIMTALSLKRPVLVSNLGGLPEYIEDDQTGILLTELDPALFARHLIAFIESNSFERFHRNIEDPKLAGKDINYNKAMMKEIYC